MKGLKNLWLVLGPVLFALTLYFFKPEGLSQAGAAVLATAIWMAVWWVFDVTHISVTALLPIVLFPITQAQPIGETTSSYGHKFVFLYLGGFILSVAIERWNLHKRIALNIINAIGTNVSQIVLGFMIATAFLSMWISNTATAVMMLPIAVAIIKQLKDHPDTLEDENEIFGKALLLGVAYSASIGGIATLLGTPPNLVFAGIVKEIYGIEVTFTQWLKVGLPISMVLLVICWLYLTRVSFNFGSQRFPGGKAEIKRQLATLGSWSKEEKTVSVVFFCTALFWIFRSLIQKFIPFIDDTVIALCSAIVLFLLPTSEVNRKILTWDEAVQIPWGIIILFGGGMALAGGFESSGLALWIGQQFQSFNELPVFLLIIALITAVNFLTEVTSNLATTAMLLPVLAPMALSIDVHPYLLLVSATLAASCAFMLPVATPPNAVVFGAGYLKISDMVKKGITLNVISIILTSLYIYFVLGEVWGIEVNRFPVST